jgi:hypothetical protein
VLDSDLEKSCANVKARIDRIITTITIVIVTIMMMIIVIAMMHLRDRPPEGWLAAPETAPDGEAKAEA